MKRKQLLALALVLLTLVLCACGGPGGDPEPAEAPADPSAEPSSTAPVPSDVPPSESRPEPSEATEPFVGPSVETEEPVTLPTEPDLPRPEPVLAEPEAPRPAECYGEIRAAMAVWDYGLRTDFTQNALPEGEDAEGPVGDGGVEEERGGIPVPGTELGGTVKTDGRYLYLLDSSGLSIQSARGDKSENLSYTAVDTGAGGWIQELYVWKGRAAVIYCSSAFGTDEAGNWYEQTETHAAIYDVTDPYAPALVADLGADGSYRTSRLVEGTLYLITNRYLWSVREDMAPESLIPRLWRNGTGTLLDPDQIWICQNPNSTAFTVTAAISLEKSAIVSAYACADATAAVYMDADCLYLTREVWICGASEPWQDGIYTVVDWADGTRTEIKRLRRQSDGSLVPAGSVFLPGSLASPYALDVSDGKLRAVTSELRTRYSLYTDETQGFSNTRSGSPDRCDRLLILDEELTELGRLEHIARDARLYACRLTGDLGLVTTLAEPDQALLLDLTDPAAPAAGETLTLPGAAWLLYPHGEELLCVSAGEEGFSGTLTLYDRSAAGTLEPVQSLELKDLGDFPVVFFPESLYRDGEAGRVGFPLRLEDGNHYLLFACGPEGIRQTASVKLEYLPAGAVSLLVDGLLYVCKDGVSYVIDPEAGKLLKTVTNAVG